jgi:hypothetical protein
VFDVSFGAAELAPLVELYPPRLDAGFVWWSPRCSEADDNIGAVCDAFTHLVNVVRCLTVHVGGLESDKSLPSGWGHQPNAPPSMVFSDGRLIHRLLVHAIYFFRHIDPMMLPPLLRPHVRVQSDEYGELPLGIDRQVQALMSLGYLSSTDAAGRRLLLPFQGAATAATVPAAVFFSSPHL